MCESSSLDYDSGYFDYAVPPLNKGPGRVRLFLLIGALEKDDYSRLTMLFIISSMF